MEDKLSMSAAEDDASVYGDIRSALLPCRPASLPCTPLVKVTELKALK